MTDVANSLVDMDLLVLSYIAISKISPSSPVPFRIPESLTNINFYMYDVISAVQVGPYCQHQVFDSIICSLKWFFPSLPGDSKYSVSVKNLMAGEGGWNCAKVILG